MSKNRSRRRKKDRKKRRRRRSSNTVAKSLMDSLRYLRSECAVDITEKDELHAIWVSKRATEIRKTSGSRDSFLFTNASIAVSEMERLYDTIEMTVRTHFPTVNVNEFFKTIKMYLGKNVSGIYTYLTDWKTLMFTIMGNLPESGTFPTLGLHYDLTASSGGLLGIQTKTGEMLAIIPVFPGAEKADGRIYPQNGEPLENGNLEYMWEKWYELNRLIGNEKEWLNSMKYYDEVLEHILSNDLFNKKKINIA